MLIEIILLIILACYVLNDWHLNYWKRKKVFQLKPSFIFGNIKNILFEKETLQILVTDIYSKYKDKKLLGLYGFYKPLLLVTDPELVKQVTVKDFQSFAGAGADVSSNVDPLLAMNPFYTQDVDLWRQRKTIIGVMLTSSKLKGLPVSMIKVGHNLIEFIDSCKSKPIKVKDIADPFALDTVCSFNFSQEPTMLSNPNNSFRKYAYKTLFTSYFSSSLNSYKLYPSLAKLLSYRLITKESENFFMSVTKNLMELRGKKPTAKPDLIDHLIKLNSALVQGGQTGHTDIELAGYCLTVYLDSFFTTASAFGFFLLDLSKHLDIQNEIRKEINSIGNNFEDFDCDKIHSLLTLEAALKESLRLHSPVAVSARTCVKDTELGGIKIDKGTRVLLPYSNFQTDPDYFPEPFEFKLDRFLIDNTIVKSTFLPFGDGPRMCPGMRYAQIVMKLGIIYILMNYKICPFGESNKSQKKLLSNLNTTDETDFIKFEAIRT